MEQDRRRIRELAEWYRGLAEKADSSTIWEGRLLTAEALDREAAAMETAETGVGKFNLQFRVSSLKGTWTVRLGAAYYGAYLTKEQALLDAVDAARDARTRGNQADVWDEVGIPIHFGEV